MLEKHLPWQLHQRGVDVQASCGYAHRHARAMLLSHGRLCKGLGLCGVNTTLASEIVDLDVRHEKAILLFRIIPRVTQQLLQGP